MHMYADRHTHTHTAEHTHTVALAVCNMKTSNNIRRVLIIIWNHDDDVRPPVGLSAWLVQSNETLSARLQQQ